MAITSTIYGLASPPAGAGTVATTTSFSVQAGDLLVAFAGARDGFVTPTISDSGTSSSWLNNTTYDTGQAVRLTVATRAVTVAESLTVTATFASAVTAPRILVAKISSTGGAVSFASVFGAALGSGVNATIGDGSKTLTGTQYGIIALLTVEYYFSWTTSTSWAGKGSPNSGDSMQLFDLLGAATSGTDFVSGAGAVRQAMAGVIVSEPNPYTYSRPSSDVTTQWTPSTAGPHYALINETTYNDANYIYATAAAQTDEVGLQAMTIPQAGTSVLVNYRVQGITGGGSVTVSLYSGATLVKTDTTRTANNTSPAYYTMTVTSAEWGAVAVNWSDMRLRFVSA